MPLWTNYKLGNYNFKNRFECKSGALVYNKLATVEFNAAWVGLGTFDLFSIPSLTVSKIDVTDRLNK